MNESVQEYFGEVISIYTEEQGVEDGILMRNPSEYFEGCNLITANLWHYIEKKCKETCLTEPIELLDIIMKKAEHIYSKEKFKGDNDKNFFVIEGNGYFKSVWFVRNGHNKLTAMLSSDY